MIYILQPINIQDSYFLLIDCMCLFFCIHTVKFKLVSWMIVT